MLSALVNHASDPMTKHTLLFDTCIWITLAQDADASPMLEALKGHIEAGAVALLVPTIVINEFERNRDKIIKRNATRLATLIKHARETATTLLEGAEAEEMTRLTEKARAQITAREATLAHSLTLASQLLNHEKSIKIAPREIHYRRVVERALSKRAPFHRGKNSVADALHMECFYDWVNANSEADPAVFVTENTDDYSDGQKKNQIHPDYTDYFNKTNCTYSINVAEVIEKLGPFEHSADLKTRYASIALATPNLCPHGGGHTFSDDDGAYLRSQYGGLTWHVFCTKCHARFDTGDAWD